MPRAGEIPPVQVHRGDAADPLVEQLPKGAAEDANAGLAAAKQLAEETKATGVDVTPPRANPGLMGGAPEGVQFDRGGRQAPKFDNPDDAFLYGPSTRPNEPITAGARMGHKVPPPAELMGWLGNLVQAASQPDAPQEVKDLLRQIVYYLGG